MPHNLHFIQFPLAGHNNADFTGWRPSHQMTAMFTGPHLRDADPARLHFVPMHMRAIHDYLSRNVDLVLRQAKIYG